MKSENCLLVPGIFFLLSDHLTELSVVQFLIPARIELWEGELHLEKQQFIFRTDLSHLRCELVKNQSQREGFKKEKKNMEPLNPPWNTLVKGNFLCISEYFRPFSSYKKSMENFNPSQTKSHPAALSYYRALKGHTIKWQKT